jgi:hypothetical protein
VITATSQATATLTATHRPLGELVARSHGPRPTLMEAWRRWKASVPLELPPAPKVVKLPQHLLN